MQQGEALGPLLFFLSIHELVSQLKSELCMIYLDDGTLGEACPSWIQASLPVKLGGLGIRSAVHLVPYVYLASTSASADLVQRIVPLHVRDIPLPHRVEAHTLWTEGHDQPAPERVAQKHQKTWDNIKASAVLDTLLENLT